MGKSGNISVILVRSGRTEWDEADRVQGKADLPLTETGRAEVMRSLELFIDANPGITSGTVHCGPSEGSKETASIVAKRFGVRTRSYSSFEGLDLGLWEGLLHAELLERYPKAYRQWRDDPAGVKPPEGETLMDLERRLLPTFGRIIEKSTESEPPTFVLRPMQLTLMVLRLEDTGTSGFWSAASSMPSFRRMEVSRARLRALLDGLKVKA